MSIQPSPAYPPTSRPPSRIGPMLSTQQVQMTKAITDSYAVILLVVYAIGAYLGLTVSSGEQPIIPSYLTAVSSLIMIAANISLLTRGLLIRFVELVAFLIVMYIINSNINGWVSAKGFTGSILLVYSFVFCFPVYLLSRRMRLQSFRLALLIVWWLIFLAAALDAAGVLRGASDAFRNAVYPVRNLYIADDRDIALYGAYRPRAFASEPSLVGIWSTVVIVAWYATYRVRTISVHTGIVLAALAAMLFLERSPTILYGVLVVGGCQILNRARTVQAWVKYRSRRIIMAVMMLVLSMVVVVVGLATPAYGPTAFLHEGSAFDRLFAPPLITFRVLGASPAFGIGVATQERLADETIPVLLSTRNDATEVIGNAARITTFVANSFFLHWIYMGLLGGVVALWIYARFLRTLGVMDIAAVAGMTIPMWNTIGGCVTVQCWAMVFIFAAARLQYERQLGDDRLAPAMSGGVPSRQSAPTIHNRFRLFRQRL